MIPLVERARQRPGGEDVWSHPLIPVNEMAVFDHLVHETTKQIVRQPGEELLLILDTQTANSAKHIEQARAVAEHVVVMPPVPSAWIAAPNVYQLADADALGLSNQQFLIAVSSAQHFAIMAWQGENGNEAACTILRGQVEAIADTVLDAAGFGISFRHGDTTAVDPKDSALSALMTAFATSAPKAAANGLRERDLTNVLEILKALSGNRRSHDILYVFVEEVARVVPTSRCSVVRVWDSDLSRGHVMASHEDERVEDLTIDLQRYPELLQSFRTQEHVVVEDVATDSLTAEFAQQLARADIRSLVVVPITSGDPNVGSLFLRSARSDGPFTKREVNFCKIVSEAAANALERAALFDSIQLANQRLERLAITDGLTNLHNHRHFTKCLEDEFIRATRYGNDLSCVLLDIDDFKAINDTFGHLTGDDVLRAVAQRLAQGTRQSDLLARYGGEEFAMILTQTGHEGALAKAEHVRDLVASEPFEGLPSDQTVTVSVGVGVFSKESMTTYQNLLSLADDALYEAKRAGKNTVVIHRG